MQKIGDIPWGGGYSAAKKEFENSIRKITQLGYGIVIIAHVEKRTESRGDEEIEILSPAIPKRAYDIVNQLVDIIGYIDVVWDEDGNSERWLYTRNTPTIMAGSRFKYLAPKIKFGYQELVDAISDAIEKSEKLDGAQVVDSIETKEVEKLNFKELRNKAEELWNRIVNTDPENPNYENATRLQKKIEKVFGHPMKLSEVTDDQVDLMNLVVLEMEDLATELGL